MTPLHRPPPPFLYFPPTQQSLFEKKIARVAEAFRIIRSDDSFLFAHMKQKVKMADMFEHNGIFLHFTMMLNYLKSQGTKEQQRFWQAKQSFLHLPIAASNRRQSPPSNLQPRLLLLSCCCLANTIIITIQPQGSNTPGTAISWPRTRRQS